MTREPYGPPLLVIPRDCCGYFGRLFDPCLRLTRLQHTNFSNTAGVRGIETGTCRCGETPSPAKGRFANSACSEGRHSPWNAESGVDFDSAGPSRRAGFNACTPGHLVHAAQFRVQRLHHV